MASETATILSSTVDWSLISLTYESEINNFVDLVMKDRYDHDLNMVQWRLGGDRTAAEYGGCLPRLSVGGGCLVGLAVMRKIKSRRK
ncbi:hypothetical protein ACFX2J_035057 [Malus domestica]